MSKVEYRTLLGPPTVETCGSMRTERHPCLKKALKRTWLERDKHLMRDWGRSETNMRRLGLVDVDVPAVEPFLTAVN